jgi:hypothetical protein
MVRTMMAVAAFVALVLGSSRGLIWLIWLNSRRDEYLQKANVLTTRAQEERESEQLYRQLAEGFAGSAKSAAALDQMPRDPRSGRSEPWDIDPGIYGSPLLSTGSHVLNLSIEARRWLDGANSHGRMAERYARSAAKYERAAHYPWRSVPPDLPPSE